MRTIIKIISTLIIAAAIVIVAVEVAQPSQAVTQQQINAYIRDHGGIPPCTHEDGAGQPGKCYWSDGRGNPVVLVPTMPGHDKRVVSLSR